MKNLIIYIVLILLLASCSKRVVVSSNKYFDDYEYKYNFYYFKPSPYEINLWQVPSPYLRTNPMNTIQILSGPEPKKEIPRRTRIPMYPGR